MHKHRQLALYGTGCAACAAAVGVPIIMHPVPDLFIDIAVGLCLIGITVIAWAAGRSLRFQSRLRRFLRQLLAGNYEAGIRVSGSRDEIQTLERNLEKLGQQLRTYDKLRADRVRTVHLLLDLVMEQVSQPFLLIDVKKGLIELNPSFQAQFNAGQRKYNLSALTKIETNNPFSLLLEKASDTDKTAQEGRVPLHFPGSSSPGTLDGRFYPVKNAQGEVDLVLVACRA